MKNDSDTEQGQQQEEAVFNLDSSSPSEKICLPNKTIVELERPKNDEVTALMPSKLLIGNDMHHTKGAEDE